jgi:Zn-dependent protease
VPDEQESALARLRRLEGASAQRAGAPGQGRPALSPGERAGAGDGAGSARRRGVIGTVIALLIAVVLKGKWILLFVLGKGKLLLGALKIGPLFTTLSTMALSVVAYTGIYGAKLAAGVVILILVRELGHGIAAKLLGLRVGAPIFIPFFGAVIALKEQPKSAWIECLVGFGGPFAGLLGSAACVGLSLGTCPGPTAGLLMVLAWLTATINLFNMMPVFGLDGDRISAPFLGWYWIPGALVIIGLISASVDLVGAANPLRFFMLILGAIKGGRTWWRSRKDAPAAPIRLVDRLQGEGAQPVETLPVLDWQRRASAFLFFGLAVALGVVMLAAERQLPAHR